MFASFSETSNSFFFQTPDPPASGAPTLNVVRRGPPSAPPARDKGGGRGDGGTGATHKPLVHSTEGLEALLVEAQLVARLGEAAYTQVLDHLNTTPMHVTRLFVNTTNTLLQSSVF